MGTCELCQQQELILLEKAVLGSGRAQENAFELLGSIDLSRCILFVCLKHETNVLVEGVQGRGSQKWGLELPSSSFAAALELYTNPVSASQQGNRKDVFSAEKSGGEMKIKPLVWFGVRTMKKQKEEKKADSEGKQQHDHARCRAETRQQHLHTPQLGAKRVNSIPSARKVGN